MVRVVTGSDAAPTDGERRGRRGGRRLWGYGYDELAALLKVSRARVRRAVESSALEPGSLLELAVARELGLAAPSAALLALRPDMVTDQARVQYRGELPHPPWDTVWAISFEQLAELTGLSPRKIWFSNLDMSNLADVVEFVVTARGDTFAALLAARPALKD